MNKNIKIMITYGVVGALSFWSGIMLYEYFNKDSKNFKSLAERTVEKIKAAKQENINKTFKGMYSYMADANNFRLCDNGNNFPVAMQGNYLELEKNYTAISQNGKEVYVELVGHLEDLKAMEENGNESTFIVKSIIKIDGNKVCD